MFKECTKSIPSLNKVKCPIVTDREKAIVNAIKRKSYQQPLHLFTVGTIFSEMCDFGVASMKHHLQT